VVAEITSLVVPPYAVVFGNLKWYAVAAVNPVIVCSFERRLNFHNEANVPSRSHSKSTNSNVPFHEPPVYLLIRHRRRGRVCAWSPTWSYCHSPLCSTKTTRCRFVITLAPSAYGHAPAWPQINFPSCSTHFARPSVNHRNPVVVVDLAAHRHNRGLSRVFAHHRLTATAPADEYGVALK
jgi:hypothetical protein